jgi:hypothetical protein
MQDFGAMMRQLMQGPQPVGDVVPFRNPLGASANNLSPETLVRLRALAAQGGLSTEQLKHIIAQQMQQQHGR